ncbi:MAG: deoxynucleoside kinase [Tepidanaerobacteraceae bacterium]
MMLSMAGMIGTGKTVYTARLAEELGIRPFYELVEENPLLEKYYNIINGFKHKRFYKRRMQGELK